LHLQQTQTLLCLRQDCLMCFWSDRDQALDFIQQQAVVAVVAAV
jgi:hypothetical protein